MTLRREQIVADLEERAREILALSGASVRFAIDWETFHQDEEALRNIDRVSGYAVKRAVELVCRDELGKAAIRDGLSWVRLSNSMEESVALKDGALEITCDYARGHSKATSYGAVREVLASMAAPSESLLRFVASMNIGMEQWRDGTGYEVEALERMRPAERDQVERMLIERLEEAGDWRDVEALVSMGTAASLEAVKRARRHANLDVCEHALEYFMEQSPVDSELEEDVVRAVKRGATDLALLCRTPRVKQVLLERARKAEATERVHAAALLMYLCGQAEEPFDWKHRPFFLRFGEDRAEVQAAWRELKDRTGL